MSYFFYNFVIFLAPGLGPDSHSEYGSGSGARRAESVRIHACLDPKHCIKVVFLVQSFKVLFPISKMDRMRLPRLNCRIRDNLV
jgi:hypothetical protein